MVPPLRRPKFSTDHLTQLITFAKGLGSVGDAFPFPGVKGSFGVLVTVLELIQMARMNDDDIVYLANLVVDVAKILHQEIVSNYRQRQLDANLIMLCDNFFQYLQEVAADLNLVVTKNRSSWFRRYIQSAIIRNKIDDYTRRIKDLQTFILLSATTSTSFKTSNIHSDISILKKSLSDVRARLPDPDILPGKGLQNGRLDMSLYEMDFLKFKRGELQLLYTSPMKTFLGNLEIKIGPKHESFRTRGVITSCGVSVPGSVHLKTIHIFEGDHASEIWEQHLLFFAKDIRRPNIAQLCGFCDSPRFRALIFHDELIPIDTYAGMLPDPGSVVNFEHRLLSDFMNVNAYFESKFLTEDGYREDVCGLQDHALVKRTDGTLMIPYVEFGAITNVVSPTLSSSPYKDWLHNMVFADAGDEPLPFESGISQSLSKEDFSSFYSGISRLGRVHYQGWGPTKMKLGDVYIRPGAGAQPQVVAWIPTNQSGVPKAGKWQARTHPELQQGVRFSDNYTRFTIPGCQGSASQVSFAAIYFVSNWPMQSALKTAWLSQAHHIFEQAPAGQTWGDHRACLAMCILVKITWEISFLQEFVLPAPVTAADPEPSDIYVFIRDLEFDPSGAISDVSGTVWSYAPSVDLGPGAEASASHPAGLEITQKMEFFVEGISWESQHYAVTKAAAEEYLHSTGVDITHILDVPTVQMVNPTTLDA